MLPYIGVSDTGHAEDRFPTRHLSTPNRHAGVTSKEETDLVLMEIESTAADIKTGTTNFLSSQTLLARRICGGTLGQEMPSVRSNMVSQIKSMLQYKGIPTTVVHNNVMLREHMKNWHKFGPEQVLKDMRVHEGAGQGDLPVLDLQALPEGVADDGGAGDRGQ